MVTWKVLAEYSWSPTTTQLSSFHCTAASPTPIRVVRIDLEDSMPVSSPAAPGLTLPKTNVRLIPIQEVINSFKLVQPSPKPMWD